MQHVGWAFVQPAIELFKKTGVWWRHLWAASFAQGRFGFWRSLLEAAMCPNKRSIERL
jgi:hypothetical protein